MDPGVIQGVEVKVGSQHTLTGASHCLDFFSPVLVEYCTVELGVVYLVVYHLAPVYHMCLLGEKIMLRCGDV